ncbi:unnamed protein product [Rotaria socialis]|uniref:EB domain-containing protein n=1 Tax=Rotaria socialis TaxID=392032 RepID=A0A821DDP4_9BILA|nr:unnamed protein product [Rotaria socialis]
MAMIIVNCVVLMILGISIVRGKLQKCDWESENSSCSQNRACACFNTANTTVPSICGFKWAICSQLVECNGSYNSCNQSEYECIHQPPCRNKSICYPISMSQQRICPCMNSNRAYSNFEGQM